MDPTAKAHARHDSYRKLAADIAGDNYEYAAQAALLEDRIFRALVNAYENGVMDNCEYVRSLTK